MGGNGDLLHPPRQGVAERGRAEMLASSGCVARLICVKCILWCTNLGRREPGRITHIDHAARDLSPRREDLDEGDLVDLPRCGDRLRDVGSRCPAGEAGDADGRAVRARLHDERVAELSQRALRFDRGAPRAAPRVDRPRDGEPGVREEDLGGALVHRERAREHARADVRQIEDLEQPLERAVLPHRAVRDGKHDIEAARAERVGQVGVELEADDAMPGLLEPTRDARRRRAAHLGLGGRAPLHHRDRIPALPSRWGVRGGHAISGLGVATLLFA